MDPGHARRLLRQLDLQRSRGVLCDVVVVVEDALFRAHKNVLAASSSYFKALVLHDNLVSLDTEMVSAVIFRQVLDFIYSGRLPECGSSALLTAASYLQLPDLAALCHRRLKSSSSSSRPLPPQRLPSDHQTWKGRPEEELFDGSFSPSAADQLSNGVVDARGGPGRGQGSGLDLSSAVAEPSGLQQASPAHSGSTNNSVLSDDAVAAGSALCSPGGQRSGLGELQGGVRKRPWTGSSPVEPAGGVRGKRRRPLGRAVRQDRGKDGGKDGEKDGEAALENHSGGSGQSESEGGDTNKNHNYVYRRPQAGVGLGPGLGPAPGEDLYVCVPCGRGFPSAEDLGVHVDSHTQEDFHVKSEEEDAANGVDLPTGEEDDRDADRRGVENPKEEEEPDPPVRTPSSPHICSVCGETCADWAALKDHERRSHWPSRQFPCGVCGKQFTQRGTMTRHMRSHLGLKPFACEECGMRFTRQYRLTEHMRVHSGEKPYGCQLCGGRFTQQRNLISHLKMHTSPA